MKPHCNSSRLPIWAGIAALIACPAFIPAQAVVNSTSPLYGSLSNFDVYNDNPPEVIVHGFEIELHGISKSSVGGSFGAPYQAHYGNPKIVDGGVDASGQPITKVRYESPYDPGQGQFTQTTQHAVNVVNVSGHACYQGGPIGNYETSGCEHFGMWVIGTPSQTIYRWLVADPAQPGVLVPATNPTNGLPVVVNLPAPVWNVPAQAQPAPGEPRLPEIVEAEIEAPEIERPEIDQFGEAIWVKVTKTETQAHVELNHLLNDDNLNPVNNPAENVIETEVEWEVMQKRNPLLAGGGGGGGKGGGGKGGGGKGGAAVALQKNGGQMQAGKKSVTRRYEYYKYTGAFTAEGEADPQLGVDVDANGAPIPDGNGGFVSVGEARGVQMVALNFDSDGDGVDDGDDNCIFKSNRGGAGGQRDDDGDGIGNACDAHWADAVGDQVANLNDLKIFKQDFGKQGNQKADLDENGAVNLNDLKLFKDMFGKPAGKSGKNICNALNPCP